MANQLTAEARSTRPGWAARLLQSLSGRGSAPAPPNPPPTPPGDPASRALPQANARLRSMARQLIADDRFIFVLLKDAMDDIPESETRPAWQALSDQMALVPAGILPVVQSNGAVTMVEVPGFYLDRCSVTNRQFQRFVDAGGYDNLEIWPQEVWPGLMKFTDRTHRPGPRDWENGKFPSGKADHPVVGISWHEAVAYASWVGKRLPTAAEWQKAGGWPEQLSGGACNRYPWGNVFEPGRANLWSTGPGTTMPVRSYPNGATPNGIYQLSGNVWEWLADVLDAIPSRNDQVFEAWRPMRRIVGGAFDTYFPAEASCQFITGQPELDRRENIGFRCAMSVSKLRPRI